MKIPNSFQIMGQIINVELVDDLVDEKDWVGSCSLRRNLIKLQKKNDGIFRNEDQIGKTFCHELTHCILDSLKEHKLSENEKLVDNFGSLLHQALKTMEYKK